MIQEIMQLIRRITNSAITRLLVITVLIVFLFVPMGMVKGIIMERADMRQSVVGEISNKWGDAQTIGGPVLSIPYKTYHTDEKGRIVSTIIHNAYFLPDRLNITGDVSTEKRYRGIYEAVVYRSNLKLHASFLSLAQSFQEMAINPNDILWDKAVVSVGISDLRGVKENNMVSWNNSKLVLNSGIGTDNIMPSGVSTRVPVSPDQAEYVFDMQLNLNGSSHLNFLPLGKTTAVDINSPWTSPSFCGSFLPDKRIVNDQGFKAMWSIMNLNRNYPQYWVGENDKVMGSSFGVNLFLPVDEYQKTMRSAKYAALFIVLTFVTFFITEIINKNRVHPIQYLMIGFAICLFYILLISISEHTNFMVAYLISSLATVGLVSAYTKGILKSLPMAVTVGGLLVFLYAFLYITLQLEDYALLMGSIGLFIVLSLVMFVTRKIDWYSLSSTMRTETEHQPVK